MMKAGQYYVGDLCYVMHPQWDEFCEKTIRGNELLEGEFVMSDGTRIATHCTAYGDGTYFDQEGREYGVDAGLIGCILVSDINDPSNPDFTGGNIIDFPDDFDTSYDNGVIHIGHITINTGDDDEDNDDDDNDEDDDD